MSTHRFFSPRAFELRRAALLAVLVALTSLLPAPRGLAELSEPDHILYGTPTVDGQPMAAGLVTLVLDGEAQPIAAYELGSDAGLDAGCATAPAICYALRVPMAAEASPGEPRRPGTARQGDSASLFLDGQLAAEAVIGAAGEAQLLDIDTDYLPQIPSLSVADAAGAESLAGPFGLAVAVTLRLSFPVAEEVSVDWQTADGTASAGSDYAAAAGVATFAPGETLATVEVTLFDDAAPEADPVHGLPGESFFVQLSNPVAAGLLDATGAVTIVDDDTPPALAVANLTVVEPTAGAVERAFTVSLSYPWDQDVSFDYSGVAGTAGAADFALAAGSATIPAGSLATEIAVRVLADGVAEDDETFEVVLANPVAASLRDDRGQGTILEHSRFLTFVERQRDGEAGADGLAGAIDVALSPDGEHLYAAGRGEDALAVYARDAATGRLSFVAAYRDGEGGLQDLGGIEAVAVSPDGGRVYAAAFDDDAVVMFDRDPVAGTLTLIEVERQDTRDLQSGDTVDGLDGAIALAVVAGPAGAEHLYVAGSAGDALAVFRRDPASGLIAFAEVQREADPGVAGLDRAVALATGPDGAQLYVASLDGDALAVFDRDPATGLLSFAEVHVDGDGGVDGLAGAAAVAVAPDGASVYVAGQADGGLAVFDRAPDGRLTFRQALISGDGGVSGLAIATDVAVSADGAYVYASGFADDALAVFERDASGSLTPLEVELDGEAGVDGLAGATALAVSADDGQVYASGTLDDAVAVFRRDLVAPSAPAAFASTSHTTGVFSPARVIDLEWSGAGDDATGSGLAGYFLLLDGAPDTVPDPADAGVAFVPHGLDAHSAASDPQADGERYAHLLACDHAGNCAPALHAGPFSIDATPPSPPPGLTSPSHGVVASPDDTIDAVWDPATDNLSGVAGYAVAFNLDQGFVCPPGPTQTATAATSTSLASGDWYVQVCAYDGAGHASAVATAGPLVIDLIAPAAPANLASPSHTPGEPSNLTTLEITWDPSADASLDGYAYQVDPNPAWTCDQAQDLGEAATGVSVPLNEGTWYFHVCALDRAGNASGVATLGAFVIDTSPPQNPSALASPSHTSGVWSTADVVTVEWSGAADAHGVAGYSVVFDQSPATLPDAFVDIVHASDPHATASAPLADGEHTFHLRTCDLAGNCTSAVHLGPLRIDTTPPEPVSNLASSSHTIGIPSDDDTLDVTWDAAVDATSGVAGYGYAVDEEPSSACAETDRGPATGFTSDPLAPGAWYVHVCAVDAAGLWSAVADAGPFLIDANLAPPRVTGVGTVDDTGDGVLAEDEATPAAITELLVAFSEPMLDPPGDDGGDDVTNPAGYLLLADGGDGSFETVDCAAGADPADAVFAVDAVVYDDGVTSAALAVNGSTPLPEGLYRFLVCATAIRDVALNPLDGDGDGDGGDDFARGFLIDRTPPEPPAAASTTHVPGVWSNAANLGVQWDGAADGGDPPSGLAGDWYLVDGAAATVPETSGPPQEPAGPGPHTAAATVGEGSHFFHLATCDAAGNCAIQHLGPFLVDTTPPGPVPGLASPSHAAGEPSNDVTVDVTWGDPGDGLSGLHGFDYHWSGEAAWTCGEVKRLDAADRAVTSPPLADGSWYFHLCATDLADNWTAAFSLGPFVVDTAAPSLPATLTSPSHTSGEWSSDATVDLLWPEAVDDVALAGYSLLFDAAPDTLPDATVEVAAGADPQTFSGPALADGGDHHVHLRTCDAAGNCSPAALHLGPLRIDATPPAAPTELASPSHTPGEPSSDATIDVTWEPAVDATSGVDGYGWEFHPGPSRPCAPQNAGAGDTAATSPELADGDWTFHLCAYDRAGNASEVVAIGPFTVDTSPPEGLVAASSSHTLNGWSNDQTVDVGWSGATDPQGVAGYSFEFSTAPDTEPDEVVDLPHTQDPHQTTSAPLADGDSHYFHLRVCDTTGNCAPAVHLGPYWIDATAPSAVDGLVSTSHLPGTATWLPFVAIAWEAGADELSGVDGYAVELDQDPAGSCGDARDVGESTTEAVSPRLGAGSWYAHVCTVDRAGSFSPPTTAGPYVVDPALTASNRLVNPDFDEDLQAWIRISTVEEEISWSGEDADDDPASGSALFRQVARVDQVLAITQCVLFPAGVPYRLAGQVRLDLAGGAPAAFAMVEHFSTSDCSGDPLGADVTPVFAGDTGGGWPALEVAGEAPAATASALVTFAVEAAGTSVFDAFYDRLFFGEVGNHLFVDGFESGDLSAWSSSNP